MKLRGKTVLITGASSGIGREIALQLATQGNNLVVTARRQGRLEELAREVEAAGSQCLVHAADAIDPSACVSVIEAAVAKFGGIDVAVLNAGGGKAMTMATASSADVLRIMRMNYDTFVNFLCPVIDQMREPGGVIAYTGSPAGYFGLPNSGPYSAAKAAGRVLVDTCRIELAGTGVHFVALYPGFTQTEGFDPDDVPVKSLIIALERTGREMIRAIERRSSHHMFPKRIKWLILLARFMPEPIRRWLLSRFT